MTTIEDIKQKIKTLVKAMKIKTVHIDNKLYDFKDINSAPDGDFIIARKYLRLFDKDELEFVYMNFIKNRKDNVVILDNHKIIDFNISKHAKKQFIKRLIFICEDEKSREHVKKYILDYYEYHKEKIYIIYHEQKFDDDIIDDLIYEIIKQSNVLSNNNITRARDKREIEKRNKQNGVAVRYISYPFSFIIEEHVIKTVELFSSTTDYRYGNATTSNDVRFLEWFSTHVNQTTN